MLNINVLNSGNTSANSSGGGGGSGTPGGSNTQVQFNDGGAFGGSSTLTYNKATGELISTGTAIIEKTVTANTSTAYTVDPANGKFFDLTLTGNCTLTVQATLTSSQEQEFSTIITQDGTGGRTLTISGVTWDAGSAPIMPSAAGASLSLTFVAHGSDIIGYAAIPTGSSTSSIAVGSAVSLTTATVAVITQLDLSAGGWLITANPTFLGTGVTASEQVAFLGTASGTSTTGQDTANTSYATPPVAGSTANCTTSINYFYNAATATTIYLKAKATFTIGTISAYGSLTAIRIF